MSFAHSEWSEPVNLGPVVNSSAADNNPTLSAAEQQPDLSHDGRTLLLSSNRPGGSGGNDISMSTRTPSGH